MTDYFQKLTPQEKEAARAEYRGHMRRASAALRQWRTNRNNLERDEVETEEFRARQQRLALQEDAARGEAGLAFHERLSDEERSALIRVRLESNGQSRQVTEYLRRRELFGHLPRRRLQFEQQPRDVRDSATPT